uniref:FFD box profile domain-containing protein n=1 Tax=Schistocephalus solidus TaxID=70667 RepID=A0A0X3PNE0_SCHSO
MSSQESPFVGCRIRIISKAKIRYEGFLHSIDTDAPDDPVITLSKVWSFGTEDRPSERFVGPRNEVYEQIVFRGRDLEDVRVLQSSVFLNEDPSIVSAVPGSSTFSTTKPREENDAPDPWSVAPFGDVKKPDIPPLVPRGTAVETHPVSTFPIFMSPKPSSDLLPDITPNPWPLSRPVVESDRNSSAAHEPTPKDIDSDPTKGLQYPEYPSSGRSERRGGQRGREPGSVRGNRSNYSRDFGRSQYDGHEDPRRENRFRRGGGRPVGQPRGGGRQRFFGPWDEGFRHSLSREFEGEYDIEKANAELAEELEKIDISSGNANGSTSGPLEEAETEEKVCYDSKKSFFDTLSSELMDKAQGNRQRRSHRDDMRLNMDTFGTSFARVGGNSCRPPQRYQHNYQSGGNFSYSGQRRYNWPSDRSRYRQQPNAHSTGLDPP